MLEGSDQKEAVEAGHRVSPQFRRGAMRAALIRGGGDAVQIAAPKAWAGPLHVDRAVDMGLQHAVRNVRDELRQMLEHAISVFLFRFVPAAAVRALVGDIVPQM